MNAKTWNRWLSCSESCTAGMKSSSKCNNRRSESQSEVQAKEYRSLRMQQQIIPASICAQHVGIVTNTPIWKRRICTTCITNTPFLDHVLQQTRAVSQCANKLTISKIHIYINMATNKNWEIHPYINMVTNKNLVLK